MVVAVISVVAVMMIVMMVYVVPKFRSFFDALNVELPWLTRMLLLVSDNLRAYGPMMLRRSYDLLHHAHSALSDFCGISGCSCHRSILST